jgi:segregation and condensation protein B
VEQVLFYVVIVSGFSGLLLGAYTLLIPVMQRRGVSLPFIDRFGAATDPEYDEDDLDARDFAASSFSARRGSLLERLPRRDASPARDDDEDDDEDEEDDEEELLGNLDLSRERKELASEALDDEDEELATLTFDAEVDPVLEELVSEQEDLEDEEGDDDEEDDEDEDGELEDEEEGDDDEYEEDDEDDEEEPEKPVVHVVPAGNSANDMLALFDEGSDAVKEVEVWRSELPEASVSELLAEAREINDLLQGRRRRA